MRNEITKFIKTYSLNILLIIGFVGIFIFTQFIHNTHVYKWLFVEEINSTMIGRRISLKKEIVANNKYHLQEFLFCLPLIAGSVLVDYFRSLFYPEKYLMRVFIACETLFILFFLNWAIFELFGNKEHQSLYYYNRPGQGIMDVSTSFHVNSLLIQNFSLLFLSIGLTYIIEQQPIIQRFNNYIKSVLIKIITSLKVSNF